MRIGLFVKPHELIVFTYQLMQLLTVLQIGIIFF